MNSDRYSMHAPVRCKSRPIRRFFGSGLRWIFPILGMAILTPRAIAGSAEDFEAGRKAFRAGDIVTAMAPLRRASEAGHAAAQALYGQILDRSELDEEAVAWFRKSAEQNDPDESGSARCLHRAKAFSAIRLRPVHGSKNRRRRETGWRSISWLKATSMDSWG